MYPTFKSVTALTRWLEDYCLSEPARCERLRRFRGGQAVPSDLLPDGGTLNIHPPRR